jgi:5-methylcytosine-specific restriction endonuclease McrA
LFLSNQGRRRQCDYQEIYQSGNRQNIPEKRKRENCRRPGRLSSSVNELFEVVLAHEIPWSRDQTLLIFVEFLTI